MNSWDSIQNDVQSMKYFAGNNKTFNFGEWRIWWRDCQIKGKLLPPEDYKKTDKKEK